ncbi:MAG TPA: dephospho-CoA kinase, partial [Verrucomicrobiales bacterium]|nr:dephospho-CoA kinase [Verrucomicrobiales bacterium]
MILIGLTGGIGAGKSFVSELFTQQALPLIDTDIIARQLLEPEQAAWAAVKEYFG